MVATQTPATPFDRLEMYISTNRLIRKDWCEGQKTADGYERACLLVALAPAVGVTHNESDCPASTLWPWLARLTPWIDDAGSAERWPNVVRRYAAVARRLDSTDDASSRRALLGSLYAILTVAHRHASGDSAAACDRVLALLREGPPADDPRWVMAAAPEWVLAAPAGMARDATRAARASARAGAEAAAPEAARWAATAAVRAARDAAWAAAANAGAGPWEAEDAAMEAEAAEADRIIDGILTALETEAMR